MLKHYLVTLFLAIITTSTYADIHLIGTASESDKDLLVGDPVYIRDGVINLTYFLKVKNNQYSEVKNRTVNQYGKVVKVNTDENMKTAKEYSISGLPSILIFISFISRFPLLPDCFLSSFSSSHTYYHLLCALHARSMYRFRLQQARNRMLY